MTEPHTLMTIGDFARAAGLTHADLAVEYPDGAVDAVLSVTAAARGADGAARDGLLLTPPVRGEVRAVQTWMFEQVATQLRGGAPSPWDGDGGPG